MHPYLARTPLGRQEPQRPPHRAPQPPALISSAASPASQARRKAAGRTSSQRSSRGSAGNGNSDQTQECVTLSSLSFLFLSFVNLFSELTPARLRADSNQQTQWSLNLKIMNTKCSIPFHVILLVSAIHSLPLLNLDTVAVWRSTTPELQKSLKLLMFTGRLCRTRICAVSWLRCCPTKCLVSLSPQAVIALMEMGFDEKEVVDALRVNNNQQDAAVRRLIHNSRVYREHAFC